jgi:hypothetical protein
VVESSNKTMPAKLAELIDDLRLRYTLGYRPSVAKPQGTFCPIKVELAPEVINDQLARNLFGSLGRVFSSPALYAFPGSTAKRIVAARTMREHPRAVRKQRNTNQSH